MTIHPPLISRLLLGLFASGEEGEVLIGDLEEEFARLASSDGVREARGWYRRQVFESILATFRPSSHAEARKGAGLDTLWQDLRFATRSFARRPWFTAVAVSTLSLGIGATTTIFSVANRLLWRPIPGVREPDRLGIVWFGTEFPDGSFRPSGVSYPNLPDLIANLGRDVQIGGYMGTAVNVGGGEAPVHRSAQFVTASYFSVLGLEPQIGRVFTDAEDAPGASVHVAVIGHGLWKQVFGGSRDVAGKSIRLNGLPFTVIGVLPAGFHGLERLDDNAIWLPGATYFEVNHFGSERSSSDRSEGMGYYSFVVRGAPDVTWGRVETRLRQASTTLADLYPGVNDKFKEIGPKLVPGIGLHPLAGSRSIRSTLRILFTVVGAVLLIACANVANLLLFRTMTRQGERALRTALGATPGRVLRQHLTENIALWAAGGVGAIGVAWVLARLFTGMMFWGAGGTLETAAPDWRVAAFAVGVTLFTSLLFGWLPVVGAQRVSPVSVLKETGPTGSGRRAYVRGSLVILQVSATVVLVVGALLFTRTLIELSRVDLGFNAEGVSAADVDPDRQGYEPAQIAAYYRSFLQRLHGTAGVEAAAVAEQGVPFHGGNFRTRIRSLEPGADTAAIETLRNAVSAGYFTTLGIRLRYGRWFSEDEVFPGIPGPEGKAVLTASLAGKVFGGADPVGRLFSFGTVTRPGRPSRVIGVVEDFRWWSVIGAPEPFVFEPMGGSARPLRDAQILLRGSERQGITIMRQVARDLDAALPISRETTLSAAVQSHLGERRMFAMLVGSLAGLGLILSAVGLYALVAFGVTARLREFGIRRAIGAQAADILRMVIRRAVLLAGVGVTVGLVASFALTRLIASRLYEVSPRDPVSFGVAAIVLFVAATAAALVPAISATRVDPVRALRHE